MGQLFHLDVYQGNIALGSPTDYTSPDFDELLGSADRIALNFIFDPFLSLVSAFEVQMEHSGDGVHWENKSASPELTSPVFPNPITRSTVGYVLGTQPSLAFARFRIALTFSGSNQSSRCAVILRATGYER
jgi:hypothetical protein